MFFEMDGEKRRRPATKHTPWSVREEEWLFASAGTRVGDAHPTIDLDGTTDSVVPQGGLERYRGSGVWHLLFLGI